jgi:hypothetical protein
MPQKVMGPRDTKPGREIQDGTKKHTTGLTDTKYNMEIRDLPTEQS